MASSDSEEHTQQSRKRSRRSNSGEDGAGGKKARGRPRVDTQDATAADRRRTQIRLAQRAYRQRKETTISSLKKQSTQLHSIIEQMNKSLQQLADSTLKSGLLQLNPDLAQEFKHVKETFSSLAKTASEGQYDIDEDGEPGAEGEGSQKAAESERSDVGWGYCTTSQSSIKHLPVPDSYFSHLSVTYGQQSASSATDIISRRQFTIGEVLGQTHRLAQPQTLPQELPFGLVPVNSQPQSPFESSNPHTYPVSIPTPSVTPHTHGLPTPPLPKLSAKALPPVTTYSFEEPNFARRLARAALEVGFQFLSNRNSPPALRQRFQILMSRTIDEELDWWDSPFIHIGGAGTHFPRRDNAGNIVPIKNAWTIEQVGPKENKISRLENSEDGRKEHLNGVDIEDFEGDWFDSNDVQGYLEEHYGCRLDPRSSFAECWIDVENDDGADSHSSVPLHLSRDDNVDSLPSLSYSSTNSSTSSSASMNTANDPYRHTEHHSFGLDMPLSHADATNDSSAFSRAANYEVSFDQTLGLDLAPGFDFGFENNGFHTDLGLDVMGENLEGLQTVKQKKKKSAWLDVSKLIDGKSFGIWVSTKTSSNRYDRDH
ncbi:bzip family transcription factor protein [Stemphylium lycopersici]|nr:bzip family transcription factor protein [Stemphylium lycopersici]RAR02158.1 bzip family transcription factor protein [Stemphylium lycopersici]